MHICIFNAHILIIINDLFEKFEQLFFCIFSKTGEETKLYWIPNHIPLEPEKLTLEVGPP